MKATKLTLSVDPEVVQAAKRVAAARGTSVSRLVEDYLAALSSEGTVQSGAPVLARLRGALRDVDVEDHRQHLVAKYG